ncbi:4-amino-4-deoxy-L-arabinose transferase-like glycosyltransferase [Undibacterium sp. GrIS 1.8]|uniref:ArnT family glycosyltransferase n=1 Tax=unclassified Undibacterium TaxID=2630295 RepID=UPI003390DB34
MKPVRLPAAATIALPRWAILALCMLYILPGLIGRDPWKGDDAASFGIMWTMAHGNINDWLWPHIVGLPMPEEGPLAFWLGAICIKLFGWLMGDAMAARLATGVFFMLGSVSVWYTTYLLGRRTEAQPLKLAFGGQPEPKDFGRTLADGALLIYLGCLGLLVRSHETSAEALQISLVAYALYLCARLLDAGNRTNALKLGFVLGLLILARGWVLPLGLSLSLIGLCFYRQQKQYWLLFKFSFPIALFVAASWLLAISIVHPFNSSPYPAWMLWNSRQISLPLIANISYFFKYGIWFAWPAWPFAAWAIYAWRKQEKALHISLPVTFLGCFILLAFINPYAEESILLPILPPLAILAAFGLPTMKRSAINAVDWFAVMVLTGVAALFWLYWISAQTGWPVGVARQVARFSPDHQSSFNPLTFIIALSATVAWFGVVYWRISRQPSVLWRAVVLSSGGVILCWLLLLTLALPIINDRISYANVSKELVQHMPAKYRCIDSNIGPSQRASFAYFGALHFAGFSEPPCDVLLLQSSHRRLNASTEVDTSTYPGTWEVIWTGHRASDRDELFSLYIQKKP